MVMQAQALEAPRRGSAPPTYSVVAPVFNEAETLRTFPN